jgi:hypothetical protein
MGYIKVRNTTTGKIVSITDDTPVTYPYEKADEPKPKKAEAAPRKGGKKE